MQSSETRSQLRLLTASAMELSGWEPRPVTPGRPPGTSEFLKSTLWHGWQAEPQQGGSPLSRDRLLGLSHNSERPDAKRQVTGGEQQEPWPHVCNRCRVERECRVSRAPRGVGSTVESSPAAGTGRKRASCRGSHREPCG